MVQDTVEIDESLIYLSGKYLLSPLENLLQRSMYSNRAVMFILIKQSRILEQSMPVNIHVLS